MLKNALLVTIRYFRKHAVFSLVNLLGLTVGLASALLICLYVLDELSYDRFHEYADQLYRVHDIDGSDETEWAAAPWNAGLVLKKELGLEADVVRIYIPGGVDGRLIVRHEGQAFIESGVLYAGAPFLALFDFPLVAGDRQRALSDPRTVVLTEEMAVKYFGDEDPMGKVLLIDEDAYTITGVLQSLPHNSHLSFDFVASLNSMRSPNPRRARVSWGWHLYYTYVRVSDPSRKAVLEEALRTRRNEVVTDDGSRFRFVPISDIHLYSHAERELRPNSDINYIYIFSWIAFFLVAVACINYINLSTARIRERAHEMGVRKVLGGERRHLMGQVFVETLLFVVVAVVLAVLLASSTLPFFNDLSGKSLDLNLLTAWWAPLVLIGLLAGIGLVVGAYPAGVLSVIEPVQALKGQLYRGQQGVTLRRVLIVAQFAISTFLIVCTLVVADQLRFLQEADVGFEKEQLIVVPLQQSSGAVENYNAFKNRIQTLPEVSGVTASSAIPGQRLTMEGFSPEDARENGLDSLIVMRRLNVDYDFVQTYGLKIDQGRDFSEEFPTDLEEAYLINEAAREALRWDDPLGKRLWLRRQEGRVIGVIKDFNYASLHGAVEPLIIDLADSFAHVSIRLRSGDIRRALASVEEAWKSVLPAEPFEFAFLDESMEQQYQREQVLWALSSLFSLLTIFVACLGLYGLAVFSTQQRTKEIGVRKTLGASTMDILLLLAKEFMKPVVVGFLLAALSAAYAMHLWLEEFAYRTDVAIWHFLVTGALVFSVTLGTVAVRTIRAARLNPALSLRYE